MVLARRVWAEGRTRAYLGGRSATAADLQDVGGALLSFYGQHEHRKLTLASAQLAILDGFCGPEHAARRARSRPPTRAERALAAELEELRERAGARDRELDLLEWELDEIDAGGADARTRRRTLLAERERLRHAEALRRAVVGGARRRWRATDAAASAAAALAAAARHVEARGRRATPRWTTLGAPAGGPGAWRPTTSRRSCAATARASRRRPGGWTRVEERLALLDRLKRKHGGTIEAVLAYAEACRAAARRARRRRGGAGGRATARLAAARAELAARRRGAAQGAPGGGGEAGRRGRRAAGRPGHGGRDVRGARGAARRRRLRADGRRRGRVRDRAQPRRARRAAARDRVGRRALARDARADERRGRRRAGAVHAGLRRDRRRDRRPDRARGRASGCGSSATAARSSAITHLPQIASLAERHFRIAKDTDGGHGADDGHRAGARARSSASSSGCWAPTTTTSPRAGTPRSCSRRPEKRRSLRGSATGWCPPASA